jgi:hypothetical protein
MRVELTGTMTGTAGYIRGAVSRLDPAFNDEQMQNCILPDDKIYDDHICKLTQRIANYSSLFPRYPLRLAWDPYAHHRA